MSKNTEAIISFILFSDQFSDRSYGSNMIQSSDFDKIKFEIQNLLKNVISKRIYNLMLKNNKHIIFYGRYKI